MILLLTESSPAQTPVNANATQATKNVLSYVYQVRCQNKILSGQQVKEYDHTEIERVRTLTGKYPAMVGYDFVFGATKSVAAERSSVVAEVTAYWKAGGLVTLSWHPTNPNDAVPEVGGWTSVTSDITQADFTQLVTPGTPLYNKWLAHADLIAGYLKQLRDAGVVVIWRPYHEMNSPSFWWGQKSNYTQLWKNMYHRYTTYHGLNNLIWTWGPHGTRGDAVYSNYYPGDAYVDLGGIDLYAADRSANLALTSHNTLVTRLRDKPVGMAEAGVLPYPANVEGQTDYSWFLVWHSYWLDRDYYKNTACTNCNTTAVVQEFYRHPVTLTRDELPSFSNYSFECSNYKEEETENGILTGVTTASTGPGYSGSGTAVNFSIYPNPVTNGRLGVEFKNLSQGATVQIMDATGRVIQKRVVGNGKLVIELPSTVKPGVLFIQVRDKQQSITEKIAVN